ncbi:MAG: hypothetical protein Q7Q73_16655 [Verrucomicrobiota bacterium JB024]|nr:hypothetical protein [Verrucomicrobiota bacterium JB024]
MSVLLIGLAMILLYPTIYVLPNPIGASARGVYDPDLSQAEVRFNHALEDGTFFLCVCAGLLAVVAMVFRRHSTLRLAWGVLLAALLLGGYANWRLL